MKKFLIPLGLFFLMHCASGQSVADSISFKKVALGTVFQQNGKNLVTRDLVEITSSNPEAYKEMKTAKGNLDAGNVFGFAGGFLIGWPIGSAISGTEANWALAGIGAGLIVVSIPFTAGFNKHARNAVSIYNSGLSPIVSDNVKLKFGPASHGIGITMIF